MLLVALIKPYVPGVPVALMLPPVFKFPPDTLEALMISPVAVIKLMALMFPPITLPAALMLPVALTLAALTLAVVVTLPVNDAKLPVYVGK